MNNKIIKLVIAAGILTAVGLLKLDLENPINSIKKVAPQAEQQNVSYDYDGIHQEIVVNNNQPIFSSEDLSLKKEFGSPFLI